MKASVAAAGAPARDEIAEQRADAKGKADGLIGMLMHGLVRGLELRDRFVTDAVIDVLASL
jgi:hypothetical protein